MKSSLSDKSDSTLKAAGISQEEAKAITTALKDLEKESQGAAKCIKCGRKYKSEDCYATFRAANYNPPNPVLPAFPRKEQGQNDSDQTNGSPQRRRIARNERLSPPKKRGGGLRALLARKGAGVHCWQQ